MYFSWSCAGPYDVADRVLHESGVRVRVRVRVRVKVRVKVREGQTVEG